MLFGPVHGAFISLHTVVSHQVWLKGKVGHNFLGDQLGHETAADRRQGRGPVRRALGKITYSKNPTVRGLAAFLCMNVTRAAALSQICNISGRSFGWFAVRAADATFFRRVTLASRLALVGTVFSLLFEVFGGRIPARTLPDDCRQLGLVA